MLKNPNRILEEGEAVMIGICPKCPWKGKTIFTVGDEEREDAQDALAINHLATGCGADTAFSEEHELAPPESYLDFQRPLLIDALRWEGGETTAAMDTLHKKGYFTPPPRPWVLGSHDRGLGRMSFAVLDKFGDVVVEAKDRVTAELIISAVNKAE